MRKNIIIAILVLVIIVLLVFKGFMIKETKEDMLNLAEGLFDNIDQNYDIITDNVKKEDGNNIIGQEIENFLINTGLYRTLFVDDKEFNFITNVNLFNTKTDNITINFKAANGDVISNNFKYIRNGETEYFIADNFEESNKEKEKFYLNTDLENETELNSYNNQTQTFIVSEVFQTGYEDDKLYIEIFKESKEDIITSSKNTLNDELKSLKKINNNYNIEWNNNYSLFSVYYEKGVEEKVISNTMKTSILFSSMILQALNNEQDWHLTINYYDYQTNELLNTETFR
mgnify:FL=1